VLSIVELVIVFAISWWLVFIPVLGVGTESQDASGDVVSGSDAGTSFPLPKMHLLRRRLFRIS